LVAWCWCARLVETTHSAEHTAHSHGGGGDFEQISPALEIEIGGLRYSAMDANATFEAVCWLMLF
jgi:hypothetical protein